MKKELLEKRYGGIGGSDASIILGLSPWKSKLELWYEKTRKHSINNIDSLILNLGTFLEPFIANEYSRLTGRILETRPIKIHPDHDFMLANIDREIIKDPKGQGILEIKSKGAFEDWKDEIPIYYIVQLQHYLSVYNYKWGSFAVLDLGKRKINYVDIERDDELISKLIEEERNFWDLVQKKIPPPIDSSKSCESFLRSYYSKGESTVIDLTENEQVNSLIDDLKEINAQAKILKEDERYAKNQIMQIMGINEKAIGNGFSINWKSPKDKEKFDLERFKNDYPQLALKYIKPEPQERRFNIYYKKKKDT